MREWCGTFIRVENNSEDSWPLTAEQAAGRELRRLRTARGWSQEEVARRMTVYGHGWHQAIVAKTEAAQRPLRLNEAADLLALYGTGLESLVMSGPEADARAVLRDAEIEEAACRQAAGDAAALHAAARKRLKNAREVLARQRNTGGTDPYCVARRIVSEGLIPRGAGLPCADCGTDTAPYEGPCEYYAVHNEIWGRAGMDKDGGFLCIGCLEKRLGRPLHRADFGHAPINSPHLVRGQSRRLIEALERKPGEPAATHD